MLIKHDKAPLCLTYPLFAGQEGGAHVAVQPVVPNLRWDLVAAKSDLLVVRSVTRLTR